MTSELIVTSNPHSLNRHLFVVDNYHLLKSLDTGCIDLNLHRPAIREE